MRTVLMLLLFCGSASAAEPVDFNRDVRPILADLCFRCHGPDPKTREAGVRLDTAAGLTAKRAGGKVVQPGTPGESLLIERITHADQDVVMPPPTEVKRPTASQIETLKRWIAEGAKTAGHWAFEPMKPAGKTIDELLNADIAHAKVTPTPEADRVTLIRRLSFDLTGLPPTPEDVAAFVADRSPQAYETLVNRLLATPHFGERMAVFWLDLVRYADSVGYHGDQEVGVAPYRDWVVTAFNANMPFDRFTLEQLAGDLLPNATMDQKIAAGYNRLGMMSAEGGAQAKEYLAKYAAERVRNVSGAWLGVTVGCAECHDHKFDPFSTKDFYRLQAYFADIQEVGVYGGGNFGPEMPVPNTDQAAKLRELEANLMKAAKSRDAKPQLALAALLGGRGFAVEGLAVQRAEKAKADLLRSVPKTLITVAVPPRTIRVLARGNWMDDSGEVVKPGFPDAILKRPGGTTRLDLAKLLTDPANPLTARAFSNRLWKLFFGAGLSRKLDDLGNQGEWPTHPALLDDLAVGFMNSGWDVKALVKRIAISDAYRRSSVATDAETSRDPENRRYARQARFRLDAEFVRDNALAVSGLLVRDLGGAPVRPFQPAGYWAYLNFPKREWQNDTGTSKYRRGLYVHRQRQYLHPSLLAFDAPNREECNAERVRSNTPLQALVLLNDPSFVEAAQALADLAIKDATTDEARIDVLFVRALSRPAKPAEQAILLKLLAKHRADRQNDIAPTVVISKATVERSAWVTLARTVLNLHAVVTRN